MKNTKENTRSCFDCDLAVIVLDSPDGKFGIRNCKYRLFRYDTPPEICEHFTERTVRPGCETCTSFERYKKIQNWKKGRCAKCGEEINGDVRTRPSFCPDKKSK